MYNLLYDWIINEFSKHTESKREAIAPTGLHFGKIDLDPEYAKKVDATSYKDFIVLCKNGELLRHTLYRLGGMNTNLDLSKDKYICLIRYYEGIYDSDPLKKPRLLHNWCIIDNEGTELVIFDSYKHPYLIKDTCIYSVDGKYYSLPDNKFIGATYNSIRSDNFLFLENRDNGKNNIIQVCKKTGITTIIN